GRLAHSRARLERTTDGRQGAQERRGRIVRRPEVHDQVRSAPAARYRHRPLLVDAVDHPRGPSDGLALLQGGRHRHAGPIAVMGTVQARAHAAHRDRGRSGTGKAISPAMITVVRAAEWRLIAAACALLLACGSQAVAAPLASALGAEAPLAEPSGG